MTSARWPELPVLGDVALPALPGDADQVLWPGLFDLADNLPTHHVVIGGVMVHLHDAVAGRHSQRPTRDVDVLLDVGVMPSSIKDAVRILNDMGYRIAQNSPDESSHRYIGPAGETVDVLAPAGVKPAPDLTTTPPGRTIEVYAGKGALQHRVLIRASYSGRVSHIPVPDLPRAMQLKAAAYASQWRRSQASAFDSRHLTDLVHLVTLIDDVTEVLAQLGTAPPAGHLSLAEILDNTAHHAWAAAGTATVDAQLNYPRTRWPNSANPHLLVNQMTALELGPVSGHWIDAGFRGQEATLERLRIDPQLEEALTHGPNPLHLAVVFGLDEKTAIRYAASARQLLETAIESNTSG